MWFTRLTFRLCIRLWRDKWFKLSWSPSWLTRLRFRLCVRLWTGKWIRLTWSPYFAFLLEGFCRIFFFGELVRILLCRNFFVCFQIIYSIRSICRIVLLWIFNRLCFCFFDFVPHIVNCALKWVLRILFNQCFRRPMRRFFWFCTAWFLKGNDFFLFLLRNRNS